MVSFLLNSLYTLIGCVIALCLSPRSVSVRSRPYCLIVKVRTKTFGFGYLKGWRGMTCGHVVILNPLELPGDLEHEMVHVEQYARLPLIYPFLYYIELLRKGYRNNKYEEEAYAKAGNAYVGKS